MTVEEQVGVVQHVWRLYGYVERRLHKSPERFWTGEITGASKDILEAQAKAQRLLHRYVTDNVEDLARVGRCEQGSTVLIFEGCTRPELDCASRLWRRGEWELKYRSGDGSETFLRRFTYRNGRWGRIWSNGPPRD